MLFCDFLNIDKHENLLQIDALILMGMINIKIFFNINIHFWRAFPKYPK